MHQSNSLSNSSLTPSPIVYSAQPLHTTAPLKKRDSDLLSLKAIDQNIDDCITECANEIFHLNADVSEIEKFFIAKFIYRLDLSSLENPDSPPSQLLINARKSIEAYAERIKGDKAQHSLESESIESQSPLLFLEEGVEFSHDYLTNVAWSISSLTWNFSNNSRVLSASNGLDTAGASICVLKTLKDGICFARDRDELNKIKRDINQIEKELLYPNIGLIELDLRRDLRTLNQQKIIIEERIASMKKGGFLNTLTSGISISSSVIEATSTATAAAIAATVAGQIGCGAVICGEAIQGIYEDRERDKALIDADVKLQKQASLCTQSQVDLLKKQIITIRRDNIQHHQRTQIWFSHLLNSLQIMTGIGSISGGVMAVLVGTGVAVAAAAIAATGIGTGVLVGVGLMIVIGLFVYDRYKERTNPLSHLIKESQYQVILMQKQREVLESEIKADLAKGIAKDDSIKNLLKLYQDINAAKIELSQIEAQYKIEYEASQCGKKVLQDVYTSLATMEENDIQELCSFFKGFDINMSQLDVIPIDNLAAKRNFIKLQISEFVLS